MSKILFALISQTDGIPAFLDPNDDQPAPGDADGDGIPDYLDTDSDDDGIPDATEGTTHTGGDDIPAYLERNDDEQLPNAVAVAAIDDGEECPDDLPRPTDPMFPLYVN